MGGSIHVGCAADENMLFAALAVCNSVERYTSEPVHFHLIVSKLSHYAQLMLDAAIKDFRNAFSIYQSERDFSALLGESSYPPATFLRLELLDRIECDRCIFLDADTMVRTDLRALFDTDLGGLPVAAAVDQAFFWLDSVSYDGISIRPVDYLKRVLGKDTEIYFNAGVMIVEIREWKRQAISKKVIEFCAARPGLPLLDQDGLNSVVDGDFIRLAPKYNAFSYMEYALSPLQKWRKKRVLSLWWDPAIVHFSYKSKPWEPDHFPTPFDAEFWNGLRNTPMYTVLAAHFAKRLVELQGKQVRRSLIESRREKARRSSVLRERLLPPRHAVTSSLSIRWIGEFICTLSRLASGDQLDRDPWRYLYDYGAAIIRNASRN